MMPGFSLGEVIIPKGNCCGIFSSMYGGGSLLEMELLKEVQTETGSQGTITDSASVLTARTQNMNAPSSMCTGYAIPSSEKR